MRVSAPLFVRKDSGLNDNLNGVERPVTFDIRDIEGDVEIVHSLAKWKRMALKRYGFEVNKGIYTDMNAIRRDEEVDNLHSVYVDQWDWEKIICAQQRTLAHLQETVKKILLALTGDPAAAVQASLRIWSRSSHRRVSRSSLHRSWRISYPHVDTERAGIRIHEGNTGRACILQIGDKLKSGIPHDGRAPDYDDWSLNCDILIYYPIIDQAVEISSMGIRVDSMSLLSQLEKSGCMDRIALAVSQGAAGRRTAADDGRGHRTVPHLSAAAQQGAHR